MDCIVGVPEAGRPAFNQDLTSVGLPHPGEAVEQLALSLALERRHAHDFARPDRERNVLQHAAGPQVPHLEPGLAWPIARPDGRALRFSLSDVRGDRSQHEVDDLGLGTTRRLDHPHGLSISEHRRPVAEDTHLGEAVRDENDGATFLAPAANDVEDARGQVGGKCRRYFVEQQHIGLGGERPRQVQQPQAGRGQIPGEDTEVDAAHSQLRQPAPDGVRPCPGEPKILEHRQVGNECRILVHGHQAGPARFCRRGDDPNLAAQGDGAAIGTEHAGEHLDLGGLAGAVGAHQRMNFAGPDAEVGRAQRDHGAKALRKAGNLQQRRELAHAITSSRLVPHPRPPPLGVRAWTASIVVSLTTGRR